MKYDHKLGIFYFKGNEEEIAWRYMWTCLCDLSFKGKVEVIFRIITGQPPKRYFEDLD